MPDDRSCRTAFDSKLENLIEWVSRYDERNDEYGLREHRRLYDSFLAGNLSLRAWWVMRPNKSLQRAFYPPNVFVSQKRSSPETLNLFIKTVVFASLILSKGFDRAGWIIASIENPAGEYLDHFQIRLSAKSSLSLRERCEMSWTHTHLVV